MCISLYIYLKKENFKAIFHATCFLHIGLCIFILFCLLFPFPSFLSSSLLPSYAFFSPSPFSLSPLFHMIILPSLLNFLPTHIFKSKMKVVVGGADAQIYFLKYLHCDKNQGKLIATLLNKCTI